jgi:hypothetical protein
MDYQFDDYADFGACPPAPVPDWLLDLTIGGGLLLASGLVALILAAAH